MNKFMKAAMLSMALTGCVETQDRPSSPTSVDQRSDLQKCTDHLAEADRIGVGTASLEVREAYLAIVCKGDTQVLAVDNDSDLYVGQADCDPSNADINEGAAEICDGVDNNCDGQIDNLANGGPEQIFYADPDGDGYIGQDAETVVSCVAPDGFVTNRRFFVDCNPTDATINPGVADYPEGSAFNGIDENCDGFPDGALNVELGRSVAISAPNITTGGLVESFLRECSRNLSTDCVSYGARDYLGDYFDTVRSAIYSSPVAVDIFARPAIEAGIERFIANNSDQDSILEAKNLIADLIVYTNTVNLEAETAYLNSLNSENQDNFISQNADGTENPFRESEAMAYRQLTAGLGREELVGILQTAQTELEARTQVVVITE